MPSPTERIMEVERELQKYTIKKTEAKTLAAIGSNIGERIEILNKIHNELIAISRELYYYDMIDYLGNLKISNLKLSQCDSLNKEIEKAEAKFEEDNELKYLEHARKLRKRILWTGLNISKKLIKDGKIDKYFTSFYSGSPGYIKEKLRRLYFANRIREIEKNIKECSRDVEKHYQLLILGEMALFINSFEEKITMNIGDISSFGYFVMQIFKEVCNKENRDKVRSIAMNLSKEDALSEVDGLFLEVAKEYYADKRKSGIEI